MDKNILSQQKEVELLEIVRSLHSKGYYDKEHHSNEFGFDQYIKIDAWLVGSSLKEKYQIYNN